MRTAATASFTLAADLNRIIKENLKWRKLYNKIDLRSLNPKEGSVPETELQQTQEVDRLTL